MSLKNNQVIIGQGIHLTDEEVIRLEIELINKGHILEDDQIVKTEHGYQVKKAEPLERIFTNLPDIRMKEERRK